MVPYTEIPHFPKPTVAGHAGQMIFGELAGKKLMVLSQAISSVRRAHCVRKLHIPSMWSMRLPG